MNINAVDGIENPAADEVLLRRAVHERAEPDALHDPCHMDVKRFKHAVGYAPRC